MKALDIHTSKPHARHVKLAHQFGDDSLDAMQCEAFYADSPAIPGFERAERGCLLKLTGCVVPHTDTWCGRLGNVPRRQRSFFWLLKGEVHFKVDGSKHARMWAGDWVVFDHRREHMVLADGNWLGAAWQLRPSRLTPNV